MHRGNHWEILMKSIMATVVLFVVITSAAPSASAADDTIILDTWECKDSTGHHRITYKPMGKYRLVDPKTKKKPTNATYTYHYKSLVLLHINFANQDFYNLKWKGRNQFTATHVKTKERRVWKRVKSEGKS